MSLKELFATYDAMDAAWEMKKTELDEATAKRSDAVKAIALEIAPSKKFIRHNKEITIVVRGSTYFLRGSKTTAGLIDVDKE
jgi:hypothetical protein